MNKILRIGKQWKLMRLFKCFDMRYHTERLGEAMANEDSDFDRNYHHEKIHEIIQKICAKNNIRDKDLSLIEEELNDYVNGLVRAAYDEEAQKMKMREVVDTRIKIKRVDSPELADMLPSSES